jgi:LPS-assembly protein
MEAPVEGEAVIGTLHASSAESELLQNPEIARFSGNVTLRQGERRLRADRATYYREQSRADIEGDVQYREPGLLVRGERLGDTAEFGRRAACALRRARGTRAREAKRVRRTPIARSSPRRASTQCEPGPTTGRSRPTLHLDRETGQHGANARLEVAGRCSTRPTSASRWTIAA